MPRFRSTFLALLSTAALASAGLAADGAVTLDQHIKPLLKQFCYDCHDSKKQKGDLNLEPIGANPKLEEHREIWEKVVELIESGDMPPDKKPQPSESERRLVLNYIDGQLSKFDCRENPNPGKVTIRRLNKEEYRATIRDLLAVEFEPKDFPNDAVGHGFDNIGDVLSLAPMLMEKYLAAAEEISRRAIVADPWPKAQSTRLRGDRFKSPNEWVRSLETKVLGFYREGEGTADFAAPQKGEYVVRVRAYGEQAGPEPPRLALRIGGREVKVFDVPNEKGRIFETSLALEAGSHRVAVAYLNNFNEQSDPSGRDRGDRNLFVDYVEILAPPVAPTLPESHKRLITRLPEPGQEIAAAREILGKFARRAYRRPVTDAEVARLVRFVEETLREKGAFLEGIQVAVQAALCSPHFLYRWELDPEALQPGGARDLTDHEVASRLSYFLWSSMPDDTLLALADRGELRRDGNLEKQAARMLKDWRSWGLVSNFGGQWLQIRNLWDVSIDPDLFPKYEPSLKGSMKQETELFIQALIHEDRSVLELLDADFTFLDEKLARFYGIDGVKGDKFQRVALPKDSPRGGVLTQASVLLATSTPTRTSPVIRGKWILEQILGTPPPEAPPDVPPLAEANHINQNASLRQRLAEHTSRAECAGCHKRMDPLGFALENFDATGRWRDMDGKFPVDAAGELPNGKKFNGARELKILLKSNNGFVTNLAQQMMTYALGRGLTYQDRCAVDDVVKKMSGNGHRFSALISGIVTSEPFLKRKAEALAQNP